jgi:hypothetical protein
MGEAIPYSPANFYDVESKIYKDRASGCPTSRTLQAGRVIMPCYIFEARTLKVDMHY